MSLGIPHLVREKSHHSKMGISAHRGTISCVDVRAQGYGLPPRVFTAGEDGALRSRVLSAEAYLTSLRKQWGQS